MRPKPPEIIVGAMNTQLSIARHWGTCEYNGHKYDWRFDAAPEYNGVLVRQDISIQLNGLQLAERLKAGA